MRSDGKMRSDHFRDSLLKLCWTKTFIRLVYVYPKIYSLLIEIALSVMVGSILEFFMRALLRVGEFVNSLKGSAILQHTSRFLSQRPCI